MSAINRHTLPSVFAAIRAPRGTVSLTGSGTATANAIHMLNLSGAATFTLPAAPLDGTVCEFVRADVTLFTATIQAGGTDTMTGSSPFLLKAPNAVRFVYYAPTGEWVQEATSMNGFSGILKADSANTAGTLMARDGNARSQVADPAVAQDIATKNYVDTHVTPTGGIIMFGGSSAPSGWFLCNGGAISRTTWANLFAAIGTTYGAGDGSTTFNLPDFTNLFPRGNTPGTGGGANSHTHPLSSNGGAQIISSNSDGGVMGSLGGPSTGWTATRKTTGTASTVSVSEAASTPLTGSTDSASNVPAYTGVMFIIKA